MNEGALRADVNVSINIPGNPLGNRVELKNLNSMRSVQDAINYEVNRHKNLLEDGFEIVKETRSFNYRTRQTISMREKETIFDYRFMPEPNLPQLFIGSPKDFPEEIREDVINLDELKERLPSLPNDDREHLIRNFKLPIGFAFSIVEDIQLYYLFISIMNEKATRDPLFVADFLSTEVETAIQEVKFNLTREEKMQFLNSKFVGDCLDLLYSKQITSGTAVDILVFKISENTDKSVDSIVSEKELYIITDESYKLDLCKKAIVELDYHAKRYAKKGHRFCLKKLIEYVRKMSDNRISEEDCSKILNDLLKPPTK